MLCHNQMELHKLLSFLNCSFAYLGVGVFVCELMSNCIAVVAEHLETLGLCYIVKSHYLLDLELMQHHKNVTMFLKFQTSFLVSLSLMVQ